MAADASLQDFERSSRVSGFSVRIRESGEDEAVRVSAELVLETSDFFAIHWFPAHSLLTRRDVDTWRNGHAAR
jgi:hypothetical protein